MLLIEEENPAPANHFSDAPQAQGDTIKQGGIRDRGTGGGPAGELGSY
jgi:hypothetical protein